MIGRVCALLKENPLCSHPGSYVEYAYENFMREYSFSQDYLSFLIDNYIAFIEKSHLKKDENLIEHQLPSSMNVIERQEWGEFIHAAHLQFIGDVPAADELKDKYCADWAQFVANFVGRIEEVLQRIKQGDDTSLVLAGIEND